MSEQYDNILKTALIHLAGNAAPIDVGSEKLLAVPKDYNLLSLEKHMPAPTRKRGTATLTTVASLVQYVNRHKTSATQVYAQLEPPKFVAVLDDHDTEGTGFGQHRAEYVPPLSKEWGIWNGHNGKRISQEDFALFLEQNVLDIHAPVAGAMLEIAQSLSATSGSKFKSGKNMGNGDIQFSYEETTEATAGREGQTKIPEEFTLAIPVFQGGTRFEVTAKFRYRLTGGNLSIWYDLLRPHKVIEAAVLDIVESIEAPDSPVAPPAVEGEPQAPTPAPGTGIKALHGTPRSNY